MLNPSLTIYNKNKNKNMKSKGICKTHRKEISIFLIMLHDDTVLFAYDINDRIRIPLSQRKKISRFMVDEMMTLKSITFRQPSIFWWQKFLI